MFFELTNFLVMFETMMNKILWNVRYSSDFTIGNTYLSFALYKISMKVDIFLLVCTLLSSVDLPSSLLYLITLLLIT